MKHALSALILLLPIAACGSTGLAGEPVAYRSLARGYQSALAAPGIEVARDAKQWDALWHRHAAFELPRPQAPQVDLEREMVVCITLGTRPTGGYAIEVERVLADHRDLVVEAAVRTPPPDAIVPQLQTQPYQMIAVPRRDGDVRLRKTVQGSRRE